jgi:hypothetical protein
MVAKAYVTRSSSAFFSSGGEGLHPFVTFKHFVAAVEPLVMLAEVGTVWRWELFRVIYMRMRGGPPALRTPLSERLCAEFRGAQDVAAVEWIPLVPEVLLAQWERYTARFVLPHVIVMNEGTLRTRVLDIPA